MAVVAGSPARGAMQWGKEVSAWANLHEACLKPLWVAMMGEGCVGWRTRLLDVGCGTGGALAVGRGLGAFVAGIDPDEDRVQFARHRIRSGDLRVGPLDRLPFVDGCGTFVMSADLIWIPRPGEELVREMIRVCAPDGRIGLAVWSNPGECDQSKVFDALGTPDPFRYSSEDDLSRLIEDAGWKVRRLSDARADFDYPSIDAAWTAQRQTGWGRRAIESMGAFKARSSFLGSVRAFVREDGRVRLQNHFRYAIATKA